MTPNSAAESGFHNGLRAAVFGFLKNNALSPVDQSGLLQKAVINYAMWFTFYAIYLYVGYHYGWYALFLVLPLAFAMPCSASCFQSCTTAATAPSAIQNF